MVQADTRPSHSFSPAYVTSERESSHALAYERVIARVWVVRFWFVF